MVRREIAVPTVRILHHFLRDGEPFTDVSTLQVIPADLLPPPTFTSDFYLTNIGPSEEDPTFLELRFEPSNLEVARIAPELAPIATDRYIYLCLLMTNERYEDELVAQGRLLIKALERRGITDYALLTADALGPRLTQAMQTVFRTEYVRRVYATSFQKGRVQAGTALIGPPKNWVDESAGTEVRSGTSKSGSVQKIYLDQKIRDKLIALGKEVVVLDDARLTGGTIESMVRHCQQCGIKVKAVASVLNETEPTDTVTINGQDYPFVWLTKLPLMVKTKDGYRPIQGTYQGLRYFYVETQRGSAPAGSE
ncbi:MAG: hypothetical protein M1546_00650 [Chloroflexi bacterium]|nr:hypothetical protein [Chloroflexota bacterium]